MTKRAVRFFNTTGPCNPDDHYMLPPEDRLKGAQLHRYINDKLYWVLHAPRQTGKTTFLQNWMREINASREDVVACYVSVETCQGISDINKAMRTIYSAIRFFSKTSNIPIPTLNNVDSEGLVQEILSKWAELVAPKSLIVLFDEVDVLEGEPMISFLRQLRGGFAKRGAGSFPISIVLVGLRDLKDYITKLKDGVAPNPGSPFNIKADSAVIDNFSKAAVASLFAQRTEETGQQITQEALDYVWELSKGQPWIVNNLFMRATMRVLDANDYSTVTYDHIREACEQMVLARETHLDIDSLANRLDDPRIRIVMGKMISGETDTNLVQSEGFRLCMDWGLVVIENGSSQVVNPIYREMLAREMTYGAQLAIPEPNWRWQKNDGTLDMDNLMREFQKFWRKHSAVWEEHSDYTEAFPHLLLMAFLQRITNGGGHIDREYAAGRGRLDLAVLYAKQWFIIEVKIIHYYDTLQSVQEEGLEQIRRYRDHIDAAAPAYLVIFDRRPEAKNKTWEERIGWEQADDITVVRC